MPKVIPWILIQKFKNIQEYDSFTETLPPNSITYNNQVNCTICTGGKIHKMRQKYMSCASKLCGRKCEAKYKVEHCLTKGIVKLYKVNEHDFQHDDTELPSEKSIGLSKSLKKIIEDIIVRWRKQLMSV